MNESDKEIATKASHSAGFLKEDLQQLSKSNDDLLRGEALELIEHASLLEQRLAEIIGREKAL